jgi:tRNA U34 5-methylaminomethyl-2-thiouridine-forming methyltransferase MnmC
MDYLEIITTSDGSHTLRNKHLNETYHSIHGAVQESTHVFINAGLEHYSKNQRDKNISILEVGFGTGLNALLTLQHAIQHNLNIRYTTLEPFPLTMDVWPKLNYGDRVQSEHHFRLLHEVGWDSEVTLVPEFTILKVNAPLQAVQLKHNYDIVYYDAFAPMVQPELWVYEALKKVVKALKAGGIFVTYSAKGQLKRDLKNLGLNVETLPGPPGKNEMVRGVRRE